MTTHPREEYLVTEVSTAPPQKLQLLLIDGAIRFALQAKEHWHANQDRDAAAAMLRCHEIVSEIMAGVNPNVDRHLAGKVSSIYSFILRALIAADRSRDVQQLDQAIAVLQIERETWQLLCQQLGTQAPTAPHFQTQSSSGFSLQA
jgi:flagellar protein FliS